MRDAARHLVAAAVPAAVIAVLWSRLEQPPAAGGLLAAAALGLAPAAVRPLHLRLIAAVLALAGGVSLAFSVSPLEALPRTRGTWLGAVAAGVQDGLRGFERVAPPFDPGERPLLHALVLTAVLSFTLAVSLAVSAGRPLVASGAVVIAGGWATASVPGGHDVAVGIVLLVAALWPAAALRARSPGQVVPVAAALAAVAAIGAGVAVAAGADDEPYLDWKGWSVLGDPGARVGVRYVWDAQYEGIRFPSKRTTVLRIRAEQRSRYWRASTLDVFTGDRWLESLAPVGAVGTSQPLPQDPLLPSAAADSDGWVKQDVQVVALDEPRLVGVSQPMRVESPSAARVFVQSGGVISAPGAIGPGDRYTVWSYSPRPLPRDLLASRPVYPEEARRYLTIDRASLDGFGVPGRERLVERLFTDDLYFALHSYRPLWEAAKEVTAGAGTPYEATLALERWLRSGGGFRYEEQPPLGSAPPLVDFVARYRAGYCQHYAGAMALMLRMVGVPARVAVGFTSGSFEDGVWEVADRDAHAWVEAWFAGQGWVTFDPTPGRGTLTAGYTFASDSADAIQALGRGALLDVTDPGTSTAPITPSTPVSAPVEAEPRRGRVAAIVIGVLLAALGCLVGLKEARRRARYLTRDPRRRATAVRAELVEVLRDQRVPVRRGAGLAELRRATERGVGVPSGALFEALGRARFGRDGAAAGGASDAQRELRHVRALMRDRLGPGKRLRGALSLRSLVHSARGSSGEA